MPAPLLLDLSHTSHTRARTGIQRVARSLHAALGTAALPITHDPYFGGWRTLEAWEKANLQATEPVAKRGAQWPFAARCRGRWSRWTQRPAATALDQSSVPRWTNSHTVIAASLDSTLRDAEPGGLLVPELFSPAVAAALPRLFASVRGPRVAIFHDAIALKFPELTPAKTVARFPAYLRELAEFDGIAAISDDSAATLRDYWHWLGIKTPPPIHTLPLGTQPIEMTRAGAGPGNTREPASPNGKTSESPSANEAPALPVVLSVGSIEGRKNHVALLDACAQLWDGGARFQLHLIGLAHPETGAAALARIHALQTAGQPLHYGGPATDDAVDAAYAAAAFTVYPSLMEGFGLPVFESLAHGKPCLCSARGALGEAARGGGCVPLDSVDARSLAAAISRLLGDPKEITALATAARARPQRSWIQYVAELTAWMADLPARRTTR